MTYILYNPLAGSGNAKTSAECLWILHPESQLVDLTGIQDFPGFFRSLGKGDSVILCGGDGTLNRFANDIQGISLENDIFYYATGSGNDFARDIGKSAEAQPTFRINQYITKLPSATANGETKLFLNGVGFGIDGYCCEVGDELRKVPGKKVNYTAIAIKGLLFHYQPTRATVTVDGHSHTYDKVWLAPAMFGKYYGGGMMPTPGQHRNKDTLSVLVFHGSGKLRTLCIFPSIFKGEHIQHQKYVEILSGKQITVEFDQPRALQIDGETILNVTKYHASI